MKNEQTFVTIIKDIKLALKIFRFIRTARKSQRNGAHIMANEALQSAGKSLAQIILSYGASYAISKLQDNNTSWVTYRNQMLQSLAQVAMSAAVSQLGTSTTGTDSNTVA